MIGIVVVSHSPALARAAVDLAAQMVQGRGPVVAIAAGAAGGLGTDATDVSAALVEAASPEGVLVLMDLGSAVLSAELSLELNPPEGHAVRLSAAPLGRGAGGRGRPGGRRCRPRDRRARGGGRAAPQGQRAGRPPSRGRRGDPRARPRRPVRRRG